jgi:type I restriction enzyme M protein
MKHLRQIVLERAQSFCVPKADIASQGYDLSINRYKEVEHRVPKNILADLAKLEAEIQEGMKRSLRAFNML